METIYKDQSLSNMVCLWEYDKYRERKKVFLNLIEEFKKFNVGWALGCSMNLFLRGIIDDFHDFFYLVNIKDIDKIKKIMEEKGAILTETGGNGFCESDMYMHYQLGRVDVDIISGFRIVTFGTEYYYPYKSNQVDIVEVMDNIKVPLVPMEAMYILYYMMEGWQPRRKFKRVLIEEYFNYERPKQKEIFKESIENNELPGQIKWAVKRLMKE